MAFERTCCPCCFVPLDVQCGGPIRFCRCPKCENDFVVTGDGRTYEFPYEYSEARIVDVEAERERERKKWEAEREERELRDYQKHVAQVNASILGGVHNMTPQQKAEALRDMEITGNYWNLDTGESCRW